MATRTSEGRFLEVLEPGALVNLPIELDVYDGGNPGTMLATLENAWDAALQVEMSEVGSGKFSLSRSDPKATAEILTKGNLVKVKTGGVYRGSWWMEEPVEVLTSTQEARGENWHVKGRGALSMMERAVVYPPTWPIEPAAYRSASHGANIQAGATTVVCPKPIGTANGDVLIAAVAFAGGSTKTVSPPLGWTQFRRINYGTVLGVALYRKAAGSSEGASYQWAFSTVSQAVVNIVALYNASTDYTTYGFASTSQGSGTAITSPSLGVEVVDGALLTFAAATAGTGMTPPVGYTEATDDSQRTGRVLESAVLVGPALGDTGDKITTNSASGGWIGIHLYIPSTATNEATFGGETFGAIMGTLIDRSQARGAITDLTYDFSGDVDSQGQPWPNTFDLTFHAGTSLLDVWRHLVSLGLEGEMSHDLKLSAFVDMSRDRTGDVILRKGSHFLGDVANIGHYVDLRTRFIVEGAGGRLVEVTNPALEAMPAIGRREGYLSMATSDTATDLARAGEQALAIAALEDEARTIPVDHGLLSRGQYEPWEDYRLGDYIGLDPDGNGIATAERCVGITISHREALDYHVILDLNSVSLEASVRMRRTLDALAKSSSGGGSGSSGLSLGGSPGGGGGTAAAGTVAAAAADTPGYLYDKVDVLPGLSKSLGGVSGNRTLALGLGAIDLDDLADVNAAAPSPGQLLQWSGTEWIAGGSAGGPTDRIWTPRAGGSGLSDEFAGSSLDPSWSRVDSHTAAALEWTVEAGVLSGKHSSAACAGSAFHGVVKSLGGATFPLTIETAIRWATPYAWQYLMLGPVFSDSAGLSGSQLILMPFTNNSLATAVIASCRSFTSWASQVTNYGDPTRQGFGAIALFFRLRWTAASTFYADWSADGVSWLALHGPMTWAATPTHAGLALSTWGMPGGAAEVGATFEHFRVYAS